MRGVLTEEMQEIAMDFLKRGITTRELKLMPYLFYTLHNSKIIDYGKISSKEQEILNRLKKEGHLSCSEEKVSVTKEYFDYGNEILWLGYVNEK